MGGWGGWGGGKAISGAAGVLDAEMDECQICGGNFSVDVGAKFCERHFLCAECMSSYVIIILLL